MATLKHQLHVTTIKINRSDIKIKIRLNKEVTLIKIVDREVAEETVEVPEEDVVVNKQVAWEELTINLKQYVKQVLLVIVSSLNFFWLKFFATT